MPEEQAPESQATPGRDVFISYASQDKVVADAIVEALEKDGIKCWIAPRDVTPGAHYADEIILAISAARALILVLSDSALASKHVGKEIERASSKGRPIIALRTGVAPLPPAFEYFLSESQWIEAQAGNMQAAYAKLIAAIRKPEEPAPTRSPAATPPAVTVPAAPPASRRTRILLGAGLAVVTITVAALYGSKFWPIKDAPSEKPSLAATPAATISDKSIAVLPFVDMSEKHDQEYFSDGLSEELIDHLAHIQDLKVIARTSSFAFKGKNEDMRSIAAKLGVANLLEGSVRKSGGELRITAQLIRALDGVHLWSEIYDRKLTDIFKVQDEISTTVAKALNTVLSVPAAAGGQLASRGTTNIAAYNLLLQGNYIYHRGNLGDTARSVELIQQALALDPHYALAWAKLARVYSYQGLDGEIGGAEAMAKGQDAVKRALAINPNCAEAYDVRGRINYFIVGDWQAARSDFQRAVSLDPHGEVGIDARAMVLDIEAVLSGRFKDIIDFDQRFLERDPLSTDIAWDLAWYQFMAGQLEESAITSRKLLDMSPTIATASAQYSLTLLLMGKKPEALVAAEKESDGPSRQFALACIYWATGQQAESDSAVGALEREFADRKAYEIASTHAFRNELDAAFAWLDRAYKQRKGSLAPLKVDPMLRNLHGDPRFDALLRKVKLVG